MKTRIQTPLVPPAIGCYSQAVMIDGFLFASGQLPMDAKTGQLVGGDIVQQMTRVLDNIKAVLHAADMQLSDVVKATLFLQDIADFELANTVYTQYLNTPVPPARTTIQAAALPMGVKCTMDITARRG